MKIKIEKLEQTVLALKTIIEVFRSDAFEQHVKTKDDESMILLANIKYAELKGLYLSNQHKDNVEMRAKTVFLSWVVRKLAPLLKRASDRQNQKGVI